MTSLIKKYWWVLLIGVILRLIISYSTYHTDVKTLDIAGQIISRGHVLDFYDYYLKVPAADILSKAAGDNHFTYPPAIYLMIGFFSFIFSIFTNNNMILSYLADTSSVLGDWRFNLHLLLIKLPYLLFDFLALWAILKLFNTERQRFWAFILWIFNPINLYATYVMAQHDIIPTTFVLLSLVLIKRLKFSWAAISLGLGIAFKLFPIFLLIPLALTAKTWGDRVKIFLLGLIPYILSIVPYLMSHGFRSSALVASQTDKSLYAKIPLSGGEAILLFPALVLFFYIVFLFKSGKAQFLWERYFIILLIFFILTHYHPQWFLWLTPFLIIDLVSNNFRTWILPTISLISFVGLLFFFDSTLTVGIFSPVFPSLYNQPSIWQMLGVSIDYNFARSVLQTIFVSVGIYYIYLYYPRRADD